MTPEQFNRSENARAMESAHRSYSIWRGDYRGPADRTPPHWDDLVEREVVVNYVRVSHPQIGVFRIWSDGSVEPV